MKSSKLSFLLTLAVLLQACSFLPASPPPATAPPTSNPPTQAPPTAPPLTPTMPPTETPGLNHQMFPVAALQPQSYPDVTSKDTAAEKRVPFGDSYKINRLERPFTQDMTYLPDLDIFDFGISQDDKWYYVSIRLVGGNPNNDIGIMYAVELDRDRDGFGDFLITALPPFSETWSAENIKIYADTNRDTAGSSPKQSDAPYGGNGFDKLIHSPSERLGADPDLAWVRISPQSSSVLEFAFKKDWAGTTFLYGVLADAGLRDVTKLDYVDAFTEKEAGSPDKKNQFYPLRALFAVDNTCYQAFGFAPTGFEPKICPVIVPPTQAAQKQPSGPGPTITPDYCTSIGRPNPGNCPYGWADAPYCVCIPG
ncbi:MAG: hypothetical protein N2117_00020 [Anaerolineales bacterium]|nr:hypothetical protein [Anaerolineales bacterium]MCX7753615.1 hypothetical protein [Anaerolineales bacterium]MDW8278185.1 hypothetical protein [Anaerolineales bacterium]